MTQERITTADFVWWTEKIATLDWVFAVTYADGAPHEYIADRTEGMTHDNFVRAARVIHTFGDPQKFYKQTRIYLVHDGWKYWTMDADHRDVNLINRGRAEHVYGVQNAPRTRTARWTPYDELATAWDSSFICTAEERTGFARIVEEVTGGSRKRRTLDIGAGTGLSLDLELTDAFRCTAIDPSQAMLNELVRKHSLIARVEPTTYATAHASHALAGTKFDVVIALGGSGSYLDAEDWATLPQHAAGRYALSVYAEGEEPPTEDLTAAQLESAREAAHEFVTTVGGRIERIGHYDLAVVSP